MCVENEFQYRDIINELKITDDEVDVTVTVALYRDAVLLSAESDDNKKAKEKVEKLERIIKAL